MTISTTSSKSILAGDGVTTVFPFSFAVRSAADISVLYTDASGNVSTLAANLYTVNLNAIPAGQLYGVGGTVTYPLVGSPIAVGTNLTIVRSVALTQTSSLINQGGYFPQVVEQALDVLTMALQQINETIGRSLTIPVSSTAATVLPTPVANMVLGWNATATAIVNIAAPAGAIALPAGGGIAVYTGGGNFISRTLVAGAGITITNPDGQAGNPTIALNANPQIAAITFIIDGGGGVPATGVKGDLLIPFACMINSVTLQADQSGSAVVDIWKKTYTLDAPPTVANTITAAALPTLAAHQSYQDAALVGWTTAIAANDMLRFNLNSVVTCQRITVTLKITKT
jgi:hypothetical protein